MSGRLHVGGYGALFSLMGGAERYRGFHAPSVEQAECHEFFLEKVRTGAGGSRLPRIHYRK
jgi:hypothetical protein